MEIKEPKVFISYSWSGQIHQEQVKRWADRLLADNIDIVLDIYDLNEGDDKYAFMEQMVTDKTVTHVLVICDKKYSEKADSRKAGVGTESQIISQEVYEKVKQSKFIPIVCEFDEDGQPYLPTFLKSRIWINFSSTEAENENWEQLTRLLYGKPLHVKPKKGKTPFYISKEQNLPTSESFAKFSSLQQALLQGKMGIKKYRRDFLDTCIKYADDLRTRERPNTENFGEKVLDDANKLKPIRDLITDWILVESEITSEDEFSNVLIEFLEKLKELKARPPEISSWNDSWFEAHSVFVYETFLYVVAALLKTECYHTLHEVFTSHYLLASPQRIHRDSKFESFGGFYGYSDALQKVLAPEGRRLYAPAAELVKRHADREDLPFVSIIQAELLTLLMAFISEETRWYPQTFHYSTYEYEYPFFVRATQHKYFKKLAVVTGIQDIEELRKKVREGHERLNVNNWYEFRFERDFWGTMNMEKLDSLK
ncbi:SEFIR domain-containing protein [Ekhidna sp.]